MKISCPSCEAKYSIGDEKVQNRLAKIRCRKCGADIVIDGRVEPATISLGNADALAAAAPGGAGATSAAPQEFTVDFGENDQRTMSLADLIAAHGAGQVNNETYVWAEGMSEWTQLGQVPGIVAALNNAVAAPIQADHELVVPHAEPQHAAPAVSTRTAAAAKPAGRDLFGASAHASNEDEAAHARGALDAQANANTGLRNESSVLFSLSALTATTKTRTAVPATSASVSSSLDDSGLIDLKALASQASSPAVSNKPEAAPAPLAPAPLGIAPLGGLSAPLGGAPFASAASPGGPLGADFAPQQKSKTGLFIGGGIAIAAVIVGLAIALRPAAAPAPAPAPTASSPAPVEPAPTPKPAQAEQPAPTASSIAKPPPTGTEEPSTAAKKPPPAAKGPSKAPAPSGGSKKPAGNSSGSGDTPSQPKPTPKPASNHCGCAPTDLPCNMRCSAKGG